MNRNFVLIILLQLLVSCAPLSQDPENTDLLAYHSQTRDQSLLSHFHPIFLVEKQDKLFNRIGTPKAELLDNGKEKIFVDPSEATVYTEVRTFRTASDMYTNLIYRIHFPKTPFRLLPFQIGAGRNVGLIIIITLNNSVQPVLYTTVHTCGCYLAFIPTTYLPSNAYPPQWPEKTQIVYTEALPSVLDPQSYQMKDPQLVVLIKNASHRIKKLWLTDEHIPEGFMTSPVTTRPLASLEKLPLKQGNETTSFYETSGQRIGYVKGSYKPFEKILIGWWAFDWRVGEDKKLSPDTNDPPTFYTSLKPWARNASDLRNFSTFLTYWGWKL